jgi:hypothetical protein
MNQQIEVLLKARNPVFQVWDYSSEMSTVSVLPNVPSCHHKGFHEHWIFPGFLPPCDDLQSISCMIPIKVKKIPALFSKTTVEYEMFHCLLRRIMAEHTVKSSVQTHVSPSQHIPCI